MSAPPPTSVSQSRKAAMVVQLLLRDGGDLPLSQLPEEARARRHAFAKKRPLNRGATRGTWSSILIPKT